MTNPPDEGRAFARVDWFDARGEWVVIDRHGSQIAWPNPGEHWERWDAEARRDTLNVAVKKAVEEKDVRIAELQDLIVRLRQAECKEPGCGKKMDDHECPHLVAHAVKGALEKAITSMCSMCCKGSDWKREQLSSGDFFHVLNGHEVPCRATTIHRLSESYTSDGGGK